jgi:Concanavalin A-like lectin/glucanases superfamily
VAAQVLTGADGGAAARAVAGKRRSSSMRRWTGTALGTALVVTPVIALAGPAQAATTTAALWHMDSTSVMTDSSGHGNNGKTTAITSAAGSSGSGYHFNGKTSIVNVADASSLDPGTATLRFTVHVRFTVAPSKSVGDYDLIRKGLAGTAGGDWKLEILPASGRPAPAYCHFQDANKKTASVRGGTNLADGAWHTITCAKTATAVSVTVDGRTTSVKAKLGSIANNQPLALGQKPGGGDKYIGDMDEVSIQVG